MQVFDLGINDLDDPISFNLNDRPSKPSVNFGPGVELLMNDKRRSSSNSINVDLGELDKLEDELNDLSGMSGENKTLSGFSTNFFGDNNNNSKAIHFNNDDSGLGQATANSVSGVSKTFDGFSKMNDVPLEAPAVKMTDRDKRRKKKLMIQKLEEWYDKGIIKNSSHFNSDSNYEEIEDEYESALPRRRMTATLRSAAAERCGALSTPPRTAGYTRGPGRSPPRAPAVERPRRPEPTPEPGTTRLWRSVGRWRGRARRAGGYVAP